MLGGILLELYAIIDQPLPIQQYTVQLKNVPVHQLSTDINGRKS
jgi:hypothetical protein